MTKQTEQTEVVKIRLGSSEKTALEAIAEREWLKGKRDENFNPRPDGFRGTKKG